MSSAATVTAVEVVHFAYPLPDIAPHPTLRIPIYTPGAQWLRSAYVVRVESSDGLVGEYVGDRGVDAHLEDSARILLGRRVVDREGFYAVAKHAAALGAHQIGLGVLDIALWDLAGKMYEAPLCELLGGAPRRLPAYASTHVGDREPKVGSSRVDLQACKLEYSIVSPK